MMKPWSELLKMNPEDRAAYMALPEVAAEMAEDERKSREAKEERERRDAAYFAARQPEEAKCLMVSVGVPRRAIGIVIEKADETEAIKAASEADDLLVLSGSPGCGKTIAAALWV